MSIPIELWGKDHWSTLAYVETRVVDHKGVVDNRQLRCSSTQHPQWAHCPNDDAYDTRLIGSSTASMHDDWDCIEDMVAAGLVEWHGTGLHPVFRLTEQGKKVSAALRGHLADGGALGNFVWPKPRRG